MFTSSNWAERVRGRTSTHHNNCDPRPFQDPEISRKVVAPPTSGTNVTIPYTGCMSLHTIAYSSTKREVWGGKNIQVAAGLFLNLRILLYRGAGKSVARLGRKQARKHFRDARDFNNIETRAVIKFFFFCKARRRRKYTPF